MASRNNKRRIERAQAPCPPGTILNPRTRNCVQTSRPLGAAIMMAHAAIGAGLELKDCGQYQIYDFATNECVGDAPRVLALRELYKQAKEAAMVTEAVNEAEAARLTTSVFTKALARRNSSQVGLDDLEAARIAASTVSAAAARAQGRGNALENVDARLEAARNQGRRNALANVDARLAAARNQGRQNAMQECKTRLANIEKRLVNALNRVDKRPSKENVETRLAAARLTAGALAGAAARNQKRSQAAMLYNSKLDEANRRLTAYLEALKSPSSPVESRIAKLKQTLNARSPAPPPKRFLKAQVKEKPDNQASRNQLKQRLDERQAKAARARNARRAERQAALAQRRARWLISRERAAQ